ncbi:hypothetical protein Tco_0524439 [Tanacetum coccineum]
MLPTPPSLYTLLHVNLFIEISIEERQFLDFICTQAHRFIVRGYGDRILLALMSVQGGKLADPLQELTGSRRKWMLLVGVQSAFASQRSPEESELLAETRSPKSSSQTEGEHIKQDKGKKAMSLKDAEEEGTKSDSDDDTIQLTGFMVESSKKKKLKKFDFEVEVRKEELVDLLGPDVVSKYYKAKLYEQDPLDKLNNLSTKKRKTADDIHDYFRANKRFKSSVQYKDYPARTVLNEPVLGMIMFNSYHRQDFVTIEDFRYFPNEMLYTVQEILFRLHQGPVLVDHARTFSSLLLAEVNKRNLNPLKQIRTIKQPRQ